MVKPCCLQRADGLADLLDDHRRQPLGRLVEQQQPRAGAQDAADRQHLLLAAGQLGALAGAEPLLQVGKQLEDALEAKPARPHLRRQQQVFLDVEAGEDAALLRAEGDAGARDLVRRRGRSARGPRSAPSRCAAPTMPMIDFSVVVLPAPLRPSSVTTSPCEHLEVDAVQDVRLAVPGLQVRRPRAAARARRQAWPTPI